MSRSLGLSSRCQHSHTHSENRAPSLSVRFALVAVLGLAGTPVLPLLAAAAAARSSMDQPDSTVSEHNQDDAAVSAMVESLADSSYRVRQQASRELLMQGEAALPALRKGLESKDPELRRRAQALIEAIVGRAAAEEVEHSDRGGRFRDLSELADPAFDEARRRLDEIFDRLELRTPERLRMRDFGAREFDFGGLALRDLGEFGNFGRIDEGIAELRERLQRKLTDFPSVAENWPGELFGEGFDSGSSRVQIWNDGEKVFDTFRETSFAEESSLGVVLETLHPSLRVHLSIPDGRGVLLGEIVPGSRAERAGLEKHDILLTAGGVPVDGVTALRKALREAVDPQDKRGEIELETLHRGAARTVTVTLAGKSL